VPSIKDGDIAPAIRPAVAIAIFQSLAMRPTSLNPLFAPVTVLPGVGVRTEKLFRRLFDREPRVIDLLFHLPTGAIDRRARPKLRDVVPGSVVTVSITVEMYRPPPPRRPQAPFLVYTSDDTGTLTIAYFSARKEFVEQVLPIGARRYVSGTVTSYDGMLQMVHPDRVVDDLAEIADIEPVYALTEGLTPTVLRRAIAAALATLKPFPEWLSKDELGRNGWPDFVGALAMLHRPGEPIDIAPAGKAWSRLAYDEMLAFQLELALERAHMHQPGGVQRGLSPNKRTAERDAFRTRLQAALPFALTPGQQAAVAAIAADLQRPERMFRLLQGDVGSGKTVVALFACAAAIDRGAQAALMAPTEILARQHLETVAPFAAAAGMRVAILTGRERGHERADILERLAQGGIDLLIGTHALFSDDVVFRDLALAVIDEQHRFGVSQRLALARKGNAVDLLVMTATPIPRTLVQSFFGDIAVSELRDKPAGRKPIVTRALPQERLDEVLAAVGRALAQNRRVYWVCPLIEDAEGADIAAADARHAALAKKFGADVGLVYGRMKGSERDAAMARFAAGETRLLVATTVIEVGVDVPAASVMVIEHAERFGLAQLHQLRGRIGRGQEQSACLLLYKAPLAETAKARLAILRDTDDGFRIAEEDLKLRGEGDLFGTRQSGSSGFRIARLTEHGELLPRAREDAAAALARDRKLTGDGGAALRVLLYVFERDAALRLMEAE
jgi:ATP-dependent DNA helicase RecG